ncbi:MAG TPA: thioredoxin [Ignavibacteria bacterium]|nr:thioredoxin [Ignavibacteria bacterium]
MKALEITDANFAAEVEQSNIPVLIDFWAVWCGPCKMIAPIIEELAGEYEGRVKIGKVDVDNNPDISMKFGIRSIPTLLIFKDGKKVDEIVGAVPKPQITAKLDSQLVTA